MKISEEVKNKLYREYSLIRCQRQKVKGIELWHNFSTGLCGSRCLGFFKSLKEAKNVMITHYLERL